MTATEQALTFAQPIGLNDDSPAKPAAYLRCLSLPYLQTPLVPSIFLGNRLGCNVWLKLEHSQPSGSFKSRGLGYLVFKTVSDSPDKKFHFLIASGGNAGYAAAYASKQYAQDCTVCLPSTTDPAMVRRIEMTGATVVVAGDTIAFADKHLKEVLIPEAEKRGEHTVYCHPYNHPVVWEGNASIAYELVEQANGLDFKPDAVVCSVGGGGLYNGIVQGFQASGWSDVPVVAVETEGCATMFESLKQGKQIVLEKPATIATSLATKDVTLETIHYAANVQPTYPIVISDKDATEACLNFATDHKLLVEPACGTALSPLYSGRIKDYLKLDEKSNVVVVVCGGTNISWKKLAGYCDQFGLDFQC